MLAGGDTPPVWAPPEAPEYYSADLTPQVREQYAEARELTVERG